MHTVDLIDAHGLKIQGRGYLMFFAKIPSGGQDFQEKLPGEVPFFRILLHFYSQVFWNLPEGGIVFTLPPSPTSTPAVCIYGWSHEKNIFDFL